MKKYRRTEERNGYNIITTLDESGAINHQVIYNDGTLGAHDKGNIFEWGWRSLAEFLRERKGFAPVE